MHLSSALWFRYSTFFFHPFPRAGSCDCAGRIVIIILTPFNSLLLDFVLASAWSLAHPNAFLSVSSVSGMLAWSPYIEHLVPKLTTHAYKARPHIPMDAHTARWSVLGFFLLLTSAGLTDMHYKSAIIHQHSYAFQPMPTI